MIQVLQGQDFKTAAEFTAALNKARLANKQKWITYSGMVAGRKVEIKTFDTGHLQILRVDGINHWAGMDLKVSAWKKTIEDAIGVNSSVVTF